MKNYLKVYQMKLSVIGPVFVGNGRELGKKEYVFLDREHVAILDIEKFFGFVLKKGLSREFENFMLKDVKGDLKRWVLEHKIGMDQVQDCTKYILDSGDTALERGQKLQIMECMKDPFGNPYIPGSSIKGMLRTILLGADILNDQKKYQRDKEIIKSNLNVKKSRTAYLRREAESLEKEYYNTLSRNQEKMMDAVNDNMAGLIVSDSNAVTMDDIVLCQKIEKHADGREKKLNLLRECIRPGTEITFTITIDESLSELTVEKIMEAVQIFGENYYNKFKVVFPDTDRPTSDSLYLGGGCGFPSKTVLGSFYEKKENILVTKKVFEQTGVPRMHKHEKDMEYGVSPHILKCTKYQGKTVEMGLCRLSCCDFAPHSEK